MFTKSLAAIACLISTTAANINDKFKDHLSGAAPINHDVFEEIWNTFETEFKSENTLKSTIERKNQFALSLESIIEHNSNPEATYEKGIN
jgi:hypothetical protein